MIEQEDDDTPDTVNPRTMPPSSEIPVDYDGFTIPVPPPVSQSTDERLDRLENRIGRIEQRLDGVEGSVSELRRETAIVLNYLRDISTELGIRARLHTIGAVGDHANGKPVNGAE